MEPRFQDRFQTRLDDALGDPVRYRGYSQHAETTRLLRDLDLPDRRRKVAARDQPVPELVEVVRKIRLELRNRLLIDARRPAVRLDPLVRVPYLLLGNIKAQFPLARHAYR